MKTTPHHLRNVGFLLLGVGLLAVVSCDTLERTVVTVPEIPGARFVGNRACSECHPNYVRSFPSSPHARFHSDTARLPGGSGCESCHGPGSEHVEVGGGRGRFIINPGRDPTACFNCHLDLQTQFRLPRHHPVIEGRMDCVACHDPHGLDIFKPAGGLALGPADQACAGCHREETRPKVFPHEALRESCTACHDPHGSLNEKLLRQPDLNLCLRCHAQVQGPGVTPGQVVIGAVNHSLFLPRGTCWTSGCHTAVHGSDFNHHLFY